MQQRKRYEDEIVVKEGDVQINRKNLSFIKLQMLMQLEKFPKAIFVAEDRFINNCVLEAKLLQNEGCLKIVKLTTDFVGEERKMPILRIQVERQAKAEEELARTLKDREAAARQHAARLQAQQSEQEKPAEGGHPSQK